MDDYDGQMIFGDLVGLKLPDIHLTGEEKPRKNPKKTSPRKLVPTGDQTQAHCVTSAHATTCSTAVDLIQIDCSRYSCDFWPPPMQPLPRDLNQDYFPSGEFDTRGLHKPTINKKVGLNVLHLL